jgi:branched-chain amino acid transport system substrate-binding protein
VRRAAAALIAALAAIATGCGSGDAGSSRIGSDTLTVYTGLPLRGERAGEGRAVLRGEKLALDDVGGRVGAFSVGLIALDDTKTSTGRWDPGQVAANAREAAENPGTIAYVGDLDSGASAISLPITNEVGALQISPLSGYSGLTRPADKGEPDKYYPSGKRTFARLVATGAHEAPALAGWIRALDVGQVTLAYDGLQEGLGQGTEIERALQAAGVDVADVVRVDPGENPPDVADEARDIARGLPRGLVYAGASTRTAVALLRAVHDRSPETELFATSGVSGPELAAALPGAQRRLHIAGPLLPLAQRPATARRMARRYRELFGAPAPPQALYGYEAMRDVLSAIRRAGRHGNDRQAVIDALFAGGPRDSVLGAYTIDARGDTTNDAVGGFGAQAGRLRFERILPAAAG